MSKEIVEIRKLVIVLTNTTQHLYTNIIYLNNNLVRKYNDEIINILDKHKYSNKVPSLIVGTLGCIFKRYCLIEHY